MVYVSIIDSKGVVSMRMRNSIALVAMGVGGTLLYQQVKNGNAKRCLRDIKKVTKKTYEDLEDMM